MSLNDFNFIETCFHSNLPNTCYFGFFDLLLGSVFLFFNFYGFIKMTHFFQKIKFENMLILLSLVQLILFLISMIILIRILIYLFIFIQIVIISLMNYKFIKLSKGFLDIKFTWLNKVVIIINIFYLFALIILNAFSFDYNYIFCCYYFIELIASITLTFYCCKYLNLIKKRILERKKSKMKINIGTESEKKSSEYKNADEIKNNNMFFYNFISNDGDELFYIFKKRQLTILYLADILCTIFECGSQICLIIIESSEIKQLFIYIYNFICVCHNIIIFFIFYWIIRRQYNQTLNMADLYNDDLDEDGIIDDEFIQEVIRIETHENLIKEEKKKKKDLSHSKSYFDEDL